ncbi:MAG: Uma2 family endonuclease [bacterium]|nr:Uma2 family endonuclease [bacterium]
MIALAPPVTLEAFETFLSRPENADRLFELVHGEIVEKLPTEEHGIIALNIGFVLQTYFRAHSIGRVATEARHRPASGDADDRLPDVSAVLDLSRPVTRQGAAPYLPELCIEIQSPGQSLRALLDKALFYLANGSKMVWLVYPERREVEVLTADSRAFYGEADTLTAGDLLPGFSASVRDFFFGV